MNKCLWFAKVKTFFEWTGALIICIKQVKRFAECDKCSDRLGVRKICKTSFNEKDADEAAIVG